MRLNPASQGHVSRYELRRGTRYARDTAFPVCLYELAFPPEDHILSQHSHSFITQNHLRKTVQSKPRFNNYHLQTISPISIEMDDCDFPPPRAHYTEPSDLEKLNDPDIYERWLKEVRPFLGEFLSSSGWNGTIVIHDEAGAILKEFEPRETDQIMHEMNLVQSPDGKFRLKSSPTFESGPAVMTLFRTLAAQLSNDGHARTVDSLIYSFDAFLAKGSKCRGLRNTLDAILAGSAPK